MAFPDPKTLLPQRWPSAFLDRIVSFRAPEILCETRLDSAFPYLRNGRVESFVGLELLAQAASLATTLERDAASGGRGRTGYVVLVSEAEFFRKELPVGVPLSVRARRTWGDAARATFEGEVRATEEQLLRGVFSVIEESDGSGRGGRA